MQAYEQELHGTVTMSILEYYKDTFLGMGFPREHVEHVLATADTEDYHRLVALLHVRPVSRPSSAVLVSNHMASCSTGAEA